MSPNPNHRPAVQRLERDAGVVLERLARVEHRDFDAEIGSGRPVRGALALKRERHDFGKGNVVSRFGHGVGFRQSGWAGWLAAVSGGGFEAHPIRQAVSNAGRLATPERTYAIPQRFLKRSSKASTSDVGIASCAPRASASRRLPLLTLPLG
jgi:hypothetical protein